MIMLVWKKRTSFSDLTASEPEAGAVLLDSHSLVKKCSSCFFPLVKPTVSFRITISIIAALHQNLWGCFIRSVEVPR